MTIHKLLIKLKTKSHNLEGTDYSMNLWDNLVPGDMLSIYPDYVQKDLLYYRPPAKDLMTIISVNKQQTLLTRPYRFLFKINLLSSEGLFEMKRSIIGEYCKLELSELYKISSQSLSSYLEDSLYNAAASHVSNGITYSLTFNTIYDEIKRRQKYKVFDIDEKYEILD